MLSFYFADRTMVALIISVVCTCTIYSVNGNIGISGNYRYRKLECKVDVNGLESVPARSFVHCSTLCSEDAICFIAHFQRAGSCMIDTRPNHTIPADATPGDNFWMSYLKYQVTLFNFVSIDKLLFSSFASFFHLLPVYRSCKYLTNERIRSVFSDFYTFAKPFRTI